MNEEKTTLLKQQMSYEEEMQRKRNAQCQLNEEQGLKFLCNEKPINTNNEQLQQQKLLNQACYSEYLKQTYQTNTHPSLHWLGMSRSQDDDATIKSNSRSYRSTHTSPFRVKFRKSHTCGSLFANCNCNSVMTPIEQTRGEPTVPRSIPQPMARLRLTSPPPCMFSISPPSGDVSMSASSLLSTKTTSGIYSLSSAPPSAQLSRDSEDSRSASFDVYATSPTNTTAQITSTSGAHTQSSAQTQMLTRQSCCEISTQSDKQVSTRQRTSGVTVTITGTDAESETKLTAAEISDAKCTRQIKRLFQSYSHPDTDFVFTDENKHPLRALQNDTVIKSKSGRVEFKQHKRSSSPNIGQVLDVAVHPDIVIKVTPKHQTGTANLQTPASATQRRRLLQRTHEIDSNSSTSGSEHSFEVPQSSSESAETLTPPLRTTEHNFDAAQKYFVESGILGPNPASNLIRKTSKILQDSHVIEQIRRTSIILRANNISKKTSIANSPTSSSSARVLDADTPDKKMESLEQTVFYAAPTTTQGNTSKFTNICEYSPTMPTNNNCLIDDDREALIKNLQGEILSLKDVIKCRDNEITKLRREIHKLKSVLQQTTEHLPIRLKDETLRTPTKNDANQATNQETTFTQTSPVACALDSKLIDAEKANTKESNVLSEQSAAPEATAVNGDKHSKLLQTVLKKQGVSGESCETAKKLSNTVPIPKYEKDYSAKQLIKDAIMDNDFLKNIDASQARELVESFYPLSINKGEFVIREGDVGAHLYVSAQGEFEVVKGDKVLGTMGPGKAFGELAILYNCTRTASIRVLTDARVWVLDRRVFQQIMMRTGMQRRENSVNFLKSVPLLKNLSEELLAKIADVLEVEFYPAGTYIIRQGANGDTFFLISQGDVKVTQKLPLTNEEKEIRTLTLGDYFGEQALLNEDKRTANIIAMAPGVECLTLDRESFTHLIGDLCELKQKSYGDEPRVLAMKASNKITEVFGANAQQEFPELKLTDLEVVATLGLGGFGRVELVKAYRDNRVDIFALKCLKKRHIVDTKQEEHVFSERTIMLSCNSPFICRLYRTFRDSKYVYMLLEACMGGEIWTMLRDRGCFDDNATQFIIGCVLQAFEYLHSRGIIYRDLKPENLMLDERGYVKLVDFGFAKYIGNSSKTWTFCGTPEYVAPEIILNKGHDRAVDYWALGILIHELLNGTPPFSANDPMKTYNNILKGIDMIAFPKHMSRSAVMLIKKLCRDVPAERLGYQKGGIQDIKKHKWFLGFDWDGLESQLLIPPFVRPIAHPTDTTYFDKFPCDPTEAPDEESGWDADF